MQARKGGKAMSNPIERKRMWLAAFKGMFKRPKLDINKTVKFLDDYEIEKALREAADKKRLKTKLERRCYKHNKNFSWTPQRVEKLRQFNQKMWFRYKEAYDEVCRLKKEFDQRLANGDKNYQSYTIESEFWYNHPDGPNQKQNELWEDLCEETIFWGPTFHARNGRDMEPFEEAMLYDGKSWNDSPFRSPKLDGICIHYFMHDIFDHNDTYSLQDLMQMDPENFSWQVNVCLEHWGASVR